MLSEPLPERDAGFYRRLRFRITVTAAGLFLFLFGYFYFWNGVPTAERQHAFLFYVLPSLLLGLAVAFLAGRYAEKNVRQLTAELEKALETARVREHERDSAQEELIHKLQEERELAREKMQFESQLSEYEKYAALAQLALGAAHEINNPLLGILSHLELELRDKTNPEERAEIEQCIEGAKRISSTIRGLLNYTRPEPLLLSKVSLERLVTDTLNFLCHQPMFRGITLENHIPADLPPISADANQLSQVLMNLLLNAAQATEEGGRITISAEKVKFADSLELRVTDTGVGIPADILPHVFEPFFTTKRGKGTGLGLSISQAYIRSHSGDIQVESVPQRGTTVRVTLPIRQEGRPAPATEEVVV
jgi:signal transduction histidine kinase